MPKSRVRKMPARTNHFAPRTIDLDEFEPIILDTSTYVEPEKRLLFSIIEDGEQRDFFIPESVGADVALRVLEVAEVRGEAEAASYALYEVLGQEAHDALKNCKVLTAAQMDNVMRVVMTLVMGAMAGN